jgi:KUP system potassium uptake protein
VGEKSLGRVPGVGIYLSSQPNDIPPTLTRAFERFRTMHHKTVILTVTTARAPYLPPEERLEHEDLGQGVYRVILQFGFMETPDVPTALKAVPFLKDADPGTYVFVMGHERFLATAANRMGAVSEGFFAFLARNARNATDDFNIPPEQVVEVGTHIDL